MRVIAPYNKREERSAVALAKYAPEAVSIDTSASIYAYGLAIAGFWTGQEDLVVIEADKEITANVIPSFADCSSYWCSYSYFVFPKALEQEVDIGLGCTRYSAKIQRMISPSEFLCEDNPTWGDCNDCNGKGCWRFLDARIAQAARSHGINVHCHGRINHFHQRDSELINDQREIDEFQTRRAKIVCSDLEMRKLALEIAGPSWQGR